MKVSIVKTRYNGGDSFFNLTIIISDTIDEMKEDYDIEIIDIVVKRIDIFLCGIIKYKVK